MTDRQLLELARNTLTEDELNVWVAKHYRNLARLAFTAPLNPSERILRIKLGLDAALARLA